MENKEWIYKEYINRENLILHAPYEPEMDFYTAVKNGDIKKVKNYLKNGLSSTPGLGLLSENRIRNFKYHFIITAAMMSRYCIDAGLSHEQAYSLSDYYIQKVDRLDTLAKIDRLHYDMVLSYTELMKNLKASSKYSKPVIRCIDHIYTHLHMRITLTELADRVSLSPSYLSRLFKKETGLSISEYISVQKIETAKNMLLYSDYSPSQISSVLGYPSQSYFTERFKKSTGATPLEYRKHR